VILIPSLQPGCLTYNDRAEHEVLLDHNRLQELLVEDWAVQAKAAWIEP
jgi:hypothetical protein